MTVKEIHARTTQLIEQGHGDVEVFTDYVEEGGEAYGFYLKNISDHNFDSGELSLYAEQNPDAFVVLIMSHH